MMEGMEKKIQEHWNKLGMAKFRPGSGPIFSINTPPPYPSGGFHAGNILNWCYIDFIARYKRMRGYSVHFPQGWDVHGLPTETKVEKWKGKKSGEAEREEWIMWCKEWTEKHIHSMKDSINKLGISCDWDMEYRTSDDAYMKIVQLSFLRMLENGDAYLGKHPVNWCVKDRTAISDAEVEYTTRSTSLWHIKFSLAGEGEIVIATTRPELLAACVGIAVNPDDERYKDIVGRRSVVPLFEQEVEIFASDSVDKNFGSGIVMICTFGDKQDVEWTLNRGLPVIEAIDDAGKMTEAAGKHEGMTMQKCKDAVLKELRNEDRLLKEEGLEQNVGLCWRCKTPVEILNKEQWFVRAVGNKERVIHETRSCNWWPDYMKQKQIDWANSLSWDWVISRQKVFGTPMPVWKCSKCKEIIPADEDELPVDPAITERKCMKCGAMAAGEKDTMDTWMDSSVTTYYHAGWPKQGWEKFVPASLQPNGAEIIRTWDYYLMLRSLLLENRRAYDNVLINGLVLGADGKKMSKSIGNFVTADEIFRKHSADEARYWASRSIPGSPVPFSWKELEHASKFYNKLANMAKFLKLMSEKTALPKSEPELNMPDKWILARMQKLIKEATEKIENYTFPMTEIEQFIWHEVADFYVEMIKYRFYENRNVEAALWTLHNVMLNSIKLLAPFAPHVTEEIYMDICDSKGSIHLSRWPVADENLIDENAEQAGEFANDVISYVRTWKMQKKLPQNAALKEITVDKISLKQFEEDLKGTLKAEKISYGNSGAGKTEKFGIGVSVRE